MYKAGIPTGNKGHIASGDISNRRHCWRDYCAFYHTSGRSQDAPHDAGVLGKHLDQSIQSSLLPTRANWQDVELCRASRTIATCKHSNASWSPPKLSCQSVKTCGMRFMQGMLNTVHSCKPTQGMNRAKHDDDTCRVQLGRTKV